MSRAYYLISRFWTAIALPPWVPRPLLSSRTCRTCWQMGNSSLDLYTLDLKPAIKYYFSLCKHFDQLVAAASSFPVAYSRILRGPKRRNRFSDTSPPLTPALRTFEVKEFQSKFIRSFGTRGPQSSVLFAWLKSAAWMTPWRAQKSFPCYYSKSKNNCGSVFTKYLPLRQDCQGHKCKFSCFWEYQLFQAVYEQARSSVQNLHVLKLHKCQIFSQFHLLTLMEVYFSTRIRLCTLYILWCKDRLPCKLSDS